MKSVWKWFGVLSVVAILGACKSSSVKEERPSAKAELSSDLTWTEAQARKARLDGVAYELSVKLEEVGESFTGHQEIVFDLKDAKAPLRVDFFEGTVTNLVVNDTKVDAAAAKKPYWIELPASALREGRNRVKIDFAQSYSHQGQGLHKFTDPQTKEVFLYSQFETFDANRFMPCFDQPDLRATLDLTVEAPRKWEVISTAREASIKIVKSERKLWTFNRTLPIATYLFSLHAGPYKVWKDQYGDIPLRLFARPSMAKYVRTKEWFGWTKAGLKFYNEYFAYKYPFKKYDQLFVPEFNAGAMENVGAVTFREGYLSRSEPTRPERLNSANVLLHEMAHMWFGDIVTMKWWNDLWLNESFASFMASHAVHEATEFKESWQEFYTNSKVWAYWEDGLVTTHPIEAAVPSVKVAYANFDGITYGKGASVLNQLRAYITPAAFQKGIQSYFANHAFKNTELKDFIGALQAQTKRDLNAWAAAWLRQSGTDTISAHWTCQGDRLHEVRVDVKSSAPLFRPQTVQLALFPTGAKGTLGKAVELRTDLLAPSTTVKGDWSCPQFVYPNADDTGFADITLDEKSLAWVKENVSQLTDAHLRTMVWNDLWQMVRSGKMPLKDYVAVVQAHFAKERDQVLALQIAGTINGGRATTGALAFWPTDEKALKARADFVLNLEAQYLKRFLDAKNGSDEQMTWFDQYVYLAETPAALDHLAKWAREGKAGAFKPDPDRQWDILAHLARFGRKAEVESLLPAMKEKDKSDRGVRAALAVDAIQPDPAVKRRWFDTLKADKPSLSYAESRRVMSVLFPYEQRKMALPFAPEYRDYVRANGRSENEVFVQSFVRGLAPLNCESGPALPFLALVSQSKDWSPTITKTLRVTLQEDQVCQMVRAASQL